MNSLTCIFILIFSATAFADMYGYTDEAGFSHYSNVPTDNRYVLILSTPSDTAELAEPNNLNITQNSISTQNTSESLPSNQALVLPTHELTPTQLLAQIEQSAINNQLNSAIIHAVKQVESAYQTKAKSPKGAQGLMQLMPTTATRFGVKDPLDPMQNIEGGAKYLRVLLNRFNNDLTLVLAAYNAGEQTVIKYGNRIPPYKETQDYVPKVIKRYKFLLRQQDQQAKHSM